MLCHCFWESSINHTEKYRTALELYSSPRIVPCGTPWHNSLITAFYWTGNRIWELVISYQNQIPEILQPRIQVEDSQIISYLIKHQKLYRYLQFHVFFLSLKFDRAVYCNHSEKHINIWKIYSQKIVAFLEILGTFLLVLKACVHYFLSNFYFFTKW